MQDIVKERFPRLPKIIIFSTILLDSIGVGFVIPILPYYVKSFNTPDIVVSSLFVTFSIFAFFSAPILGMISDRRGRRPVLIISLLSSTIGWAIFAFSNTIVGLFVGRIIDGSAAGNISTAQNYLVDIAKDKMDLKKSLGIVGAIFGIGFMIGPLAGGFLFNIDHKLPFIIVGAMALVNTVLAYFFLPETNHKKNTSEIYLNPFSPIMKAFRNKKMLPLYLAWLFFGIAISLGQSILGLYVEELFSWRVITAGLLMTLLGIVVSCNQAFLVHKVWLKYFKESSLMVWMIIPFALGFFTMALPYTGAFVVGLLVAALAYSTLRIITNSQIIGLCEENEQGEMMGVLASLVSLSLILGPTLGGSVYEIDPALPFIMTGAVLLGIFVFIFKTYKEITSKQHIHIENEATETW